MCLYIKPVVIQTPCGKRQIWHTISLDEACEECRLWFPERYPPSAGGGAAAAAAGGGGGGAASRIRTKKR